MNNLHSTLKPLKSEFFHVSLAEINSKHAKSCMQYQHEIITKCKVGFFPEGKNREPSAEQAGEGAEISSFFGFVFFFALSAPSLCNDMNEEGEACLFLDFGAFFAMLKKN